ncbi:cuticle collagen 7-like [Setaria italica]|uniref:cuticle collagen 7-like n=1 Tax=Setaria italica TaxID=4555 RepID=UPI000350D4D5|nr:cuticle collagen 7-like [Setaria italica]
MPRSPSQLLAATFPEDAGMDAVALELTLSSQPGLLGPALRGPPLSPARSAASARRCSPAPGLVAVARRWPDTEGSPPGSVGGHGQLLLLPSFRPPPHGAPGASGHRAARRGTACWGTTGSAGPGAAPGAGTPGEGV